MRAEIELELGPKLKLRAGTIRPIWLLLLCANLADMFEVCRGRIHRGEKKRQKKEKKKKIKMFEVCRRR